MMVRNCRWWKCRSRFMTTDNRKKFCKHACASCHYRWNYNRTNGVKYTTAAKRELARNTPKLIPVECVICGEWFEVRPCHAENAKVCSTECSYERRRTLAKGDVP